jgi:hypothetical protein
VISAELSPANVAIGSAHAGDASYGDFTLGSSCTVSVVDCDTEPQP